MQHYIAEDGLQVSIAFDTVQGATEWISRKLGGPDVFTLDDYMRGGGYTFCIRDEAGEFGSDDAETVAYIMNSRYDNSRERKANRAKIDRLMSIGISEEDAETAIEHGLA